MAPQEEDMVEPQEEQVEDEFEPEPEEGLFDEITDFITRGGSSAIRL